MSIKLSAIYRYPLKGLGPETLRQANLEPDAGLAGDRRHALARPGHAASTTADWLPKRALIALDSIPSLAQVDVQRDEDGNTLLLYQHGRQIGAGDPDTEPGRDALQAAVTRVAGCELPQGTRVVGTAGSRFTDASAPLISIACQASAHDLGENLARKIDIRRFRANLVLAGGLPWQELDWVGETLSLGGVTLRVVEPIVRCAATRANPTNGRPDLDLLRPLTRLLGEPVFGVYATVLRGGLIETGNELVAPAGGGRFRTRETGL